MRSCLPHTWYGAHQGHPTRTLGVLGARTFFFVAISEYACPSTIPSVSFVSLPARTERMYVVVYMILCYIFYQTTCPATLCTQRTS